MIGSPGSTSPPAALDVLTTDRSPICDGGRLAVDEGLGFRGHPHRVDDRARARWIGIVDHRVEGQDRLLARKQLSRGHEDGVAAGQRVSVEREGSARSRVVGNQHPVLIGRPRHVGGVGVRSIQDFDVRDRDDAVVGDADRVAQGLARVEAAVAVGVGDQSGVLEGSQAREGQNRRPHVQLLRLAAPRVGGILTPGRGDQRAVGGPETRSGLVVVALEEQNRHQIADSSEDLVAVVAEGVLAATWTVADTVAVLVDVDVGGGATGEPGGGDPQRAGVLGEVGAPGSPAHHRRRRQRAFGNQREAPVVNGGVAIDRGHGEERVARAGEARRRGRRVEGDLELHRRLRRDVDRGGAGQLVHGDADGRGGRVVEVDVHLVSRDRGADRAVVGVTPRGARHEAVPPAFVGRRLVRGEQTHLHVGGRGHGRAGQDVGDSDPSDELAVALIQVEREVRRAVAVGVDLDDGGVLFRHDREADELEGSRRQVLPDGDLERGAPPVDVEHLDRAAELRLHAGRGPGRSGHRHQLGRGDLVAAVEADLQRVADATGHGNVVDEDDDVPGLQQIAWKAGRCTVGCIAVAPDLNAAEVSRTRVEVGGAADVGVEAVLPLVVVDDRVVGGDRQRDHRVHRVVLGKALDRLRPRTSLRFRDRNVVGLNSRLCNAGSRPGERDEGDQEVEDRGTGADDSSPPGARRRGPGRGAGGESKRQIPPGVVRDTPRADSHECQLLALG